jgi:hypothetical protein
VTVYVDPATAWGKSDRWSHERSCHMVADSEAELDALAAQIGLKPEWKQEGVMPHYDLTASKRKLAVEAGAVEVTFREFVTKLRGKEA